MTSQRVDVKMSMFKKAMDGDWKAFENDFQGNPQACSEELTRSGDTALHLAVSGGQLEIVKNLVEILDRISNGVSEILKIENERGNTPLHLAAASGQVEICMFIAGKDPNLIGVRNHDGETPLFMAALHGKKEAFLCLHSKCPNGSGSAYYRRKDGDTILHCAITGEYLDLAFQVIRLYKELVYSYNEKGFTPLHLLAGKPSAFNSGHRLRFFESIIYHCVFVDPLKEESHSPEAELAKVGKENGTEYPQNYRTCVNFFKILKTPVAKYCIRADAENPEVNHISEGGRHKLLPPNYFTCFNFFKVVMKALLVILGLGIRRIWKIKETKAKHIWAMQIMEELVTSASAWEYDDNGRNPYKVTTILDAIADSSIIPESSISSDTKTDKKREGTGKGETPILIAARMGVVELVEKILDKFPVAIQDLNKDQKNIVLLAVENRQPRVYKLLLNMKILKDCMFHKVDNEGNSALHLAAMIGEHRPWLIPGAALQMHWEIKWYKFVKDSMPPNYFVRYNNQGMTPKEIFTEAHKDLVKEGGQWLINTSQSCSVVATLMATVAFATASTVPGGVKQETGAPTLQGKPEFDVFAMCSLVALCFSVTAVIVFLSILTSRCEESDFSSHLPRKLILGLTSLFISIGSMLVSFCAGHFFVVKDELKFAAFPVYAVTCLPATLFAAAEFPLYLDLLMATFKKVPERGYKVNPF